LVAPKPGTTWNCRNTERRMLRYNPPMSRLRRLLVSDRIFFITCNLLRSRLLLTEPDFVCLGEAFRGVRNRRAFMLTGYVFMPDHWHALLVPAEGDTLPRLMDSLKVAAMRRVNARREKREPLWQSRYFDEIVKSVKQYRDCLRYMHFNPVQSGLVRNPEDWRWSSFCAYDGNRQVPLEVDRLDLPAEEETLL
jgi:putative transposase